MATTGARHAAIAHLAAALPSWHLDDVRRLEHATYLSHGTACATLYADRVRELFFSCERVAPMSPSAVARADAEALASDAEKEWYATLRAARAARQRRIVAMGETDLFDEAQPAVNRCRRCGSTRVESSLRQTRSADEASTLFCHCLSCGKRWRS